MPVQASAVVNDVPSKVHAPRIADSKHTLHRLKPE